MSFQAFATPRLFTRYLAMSSVSHCSARGRVPVRRSECEDLGRASRRGGPGVTELNWMQEYAATEAVELREAGVLGRREMLVRLVAICGSVGAATAFLDSCSD